MLIKIDRLNRFCNKAIKLMPRNVLGCNNNVVDFVEEDIHDSIMNRIYENKI
jgi:hypothetical protein